MAFTSFHIAFSLGFPHSVYLLHADIKCFSDDPQTEAFKRDDFALLTKARIFVTIQR